jgi:hypothetical protein
MHIIVGLLRKWCRPVCIVVISVYLKGNVLIVFGAVCTLPRLFRQLRGCLCINNQCCTHVLASVCVFTPMWCTSRAEILSKDFCGVRVAFYGAVHDAIHLHPTDADGKEFGTGCVSCVLQVLWALALCL